VAEENALALPTEPAPDRTPALDALVLAGELRLSAHDETSAALAVRREAPLFAADRRLAASYARAELVY
jgi:hypothetical protein